MVVGGTFGGRARAGGDFAGLAFAGGVFAAVLGDGGHAGEVHPAGTRLGRGHGGRFAAALMAIRTICASLTRWTSRATLIAGGAGMLVA